MVKIDAGTLFFAAIFTNNILLTNFLGLCPFLAISREIRSSLGLGVAVVFVMTCTAVINYLVYYYLLLPLNLEHFRYIVFIIIIAAFVQLVEMAVERFFPALYYILGIFLPLITVNCAILGASLFLIIRKYTLIQSLAYGAGSGIGWMVAIIAVGAIREKVQKSAKLPRGLEGPALTLIITGIMALAFMAFSGMIQIQ
ncbi:MAG: NADH:ubiquinone reductase (Na(+)-transporting) subunit E [Desulfobacterales bacterium]|nr:NADH:ubiquinone reductase (Na(+)-transporting) subunit E [Desulfobacterales bacterium]